MTRSGRRARRRGIPADLIAHAANGPNESVVVAGIYFAPQVQVVDVDVDDVGHGRRQRPQPRLQMRDPLPRLGHLRGGVGQQTGEQFHAAKGISNLMRQYRRDLRES